MITQEEWNVKEWKKYIKIDDARFLSGFFCKSFKLHYCEVYYVDQIQDECHSPKWERFESNTYGLYSNAEPPHILIIHGLMNPIGVLIHELTHHLECYGYKEREEDARAHGQNYQLAKRRVKNWCKENISDRPDWNTPLKAIQNEMDMRRFRL